VNKEKGIIVYVKGTTKPINPGYGFYAFIVKKHGYRIYEDVAFYRQNAINHHVAYFAVYKALQWLRNRGLHRQPITVKIDNPLVVRQLLGKWHVSDYACHYALYHQVKRLMSYFPSLRLEYIERWQNPADILTEEAYVKFCRKHRLPLKGPYEGIKKKIRKALWGRWLGNGE